MTRVGQSMFQQKGGYCSKKNGGMPGRQNNKCGPSPFSKRIPTLRHEMLHLQSISFGLGSAPLDSFYQMSSL